MMAPETSAPDYAPKTFHWYHGNCHCGHVRFKLRYPVDLMKAEGHTHQAAICDCSLCSKLGWMLCYPYREDVWVRVPGSGVGDSREEAEGGDGWAHPRDEERGTGYRLGKGLAFGSSQTFADGKELPLLSYTHAAREDDIVFCGVCGASLWLNTKPEFAERDGDIVSINIRLFEGIDMQKIPWRKGRGKSFPPDYVPQFQP